MADSFDKLLTAPLEARVADRMVVGGTAQGDPEFGQWRVGSEEQLGGAGERTARQ
ncbi:hypothetical protein GJ698_14995 [Pseudoduganella sp. FT26W]|uniref:Uncharacterized protein n=1 Tax=Duganella aquatilis TaxID=2666082 RepID=A0A844D379_9BURK|nr:hypothetical protein [Duganella aquatilis]